jgi:O-antigen/teichoic acid export membrane protein
VSTSLLVQYGVIAVAVLLSLWVVAKKQFPGSVRKLRVALALPLLREGKPAWLRAIGLWISPVGKAGSSACGGCDGCGPSAPER